MNENQNSIIDVLSGRESIKVDVSIDWLTISILGAAILAFGTILIFISKKIR